MLTSFIFIILAIALLVKSSDLFVEYSSKIAKKLGISEFVIGFTLVAFGTSFPELVSSTYAIFKDKSGVVIGNILGSNVANIGLILGIGAVLITIKVNNKTFKQDGLILGGSTLLFCFFLYTQSQINRIEGIILLTIFTIYTVYILGLKKKHIDHLIGKSFHIFSYTKIIRKLRKIKNTKKDENIVFDLFMTVLAGIGIFFGAKFTVDLAIKIAQALSVPESFIAFTLIALGTSLPELSVTISSARQKKMDLLLGNVIGSNIANLMLVGGVTALVSPLLITGIPSIFAMVGITLLLLIFMRSKWKIEKTEGIIFLTIYFGFILYLSYTNLI